MEPQEKAHSLFIKFMDIVQDVKQAKELSQLFVNETIESFLINLKDYQVEFWIEVKKEIEKI
jgi:hypothetical protein